MPSNVVKVSLVADAKGFTKGMKEADEATAKTEARATKFAGVVQGLFAGAALGAVAKFVGDSVAAFSQLEQSTGGVEAVFGEFADEITSQAQGAADKFGLSASDFQDSATLIGSMLKNQLGLSAEEAADQVDDLTARAADMAATFGGTTADAIAAIGSLMRGERDPIEKYGVSMNDAAISAKALESGLADTTAELTPQIKAAAALELLYEQTGDAAGQFAEESDTLAGSQQRLAAEVKNAQAAIGEQLAPAIGFATDAINTLLPVVESLTSALSGATEAAKPLLEELDTLIGLAPESGTGLEDVGSALAHTVLPFLAPITAGFHNINELLGLNAEKQREAVRAMEDSRTHGVEPLTEATEEAAGATRDYTTALQEHVTNIRAQMDPAFALAEANREIAEAQAEATAAAKEFGEGSPQHVEALGKVRDAAYDAKDAEFAMAQQGGATSDQMKAHLRSLGIYTETEIDAIISDMERLNAFRFDPKTIRITHKVTGGGYQEFQTGGVVQGPPGAAVPVIAHAGETILPTHRSNGGGSAGNTYQITINAGLGSDPNAISRALVEALQRYQRANGAVPIRVSGR